MDQKRPPRSPDTFQSNSRNDLVFFGDIDTILLVNWFSGVISSSNVFESSR
jgi:hypothetical protein